jgi:tetratricopeptide (TPR) repeat protein
VPEPDPFHANLQRGVLLLGQNRPREALSFIQAAIAANPNAPQGYAELARCWNGIPAERAKSIAAINQAIGLAPNVSFYYGRKGWFLVCLQRFREAFVAAQAGLAINPACPQSLNALANAHTKMGKWKSAEQACLRILALDPNDGPGLNLLAQALRHQGRWKESRETVARLLAQMPNNAFGHANAGYAALAAGDHLRANEHFRESLRMDPHFELARRGLVQSLRARNWVIRLNFRIASFIHRPGTLLNVTAAFAGFIALIAGASCLASFLDNIYPKAGTILFVLIFAFGLFYAYLSVLIGLMQNFLLLFDPIGRHALTRLEKQKSCVPAVALAIVGGFLIANGYWIAALSFSLFFAVLAFSIQYPLLKDRWQRRREKQLGS